VFARTLGAEIVYRSSWRFRIVSLAVLLAVVLLLALLASRNGQRGRSGVDPELQPAERRFILARACAAREDARQCRHGRMTELEGNG
jgi:hypothetical protein